MAVLTRIIVVRPNGEMRALCEELRKENARVWNVALGIYYYFPNAHPSEGDICAHLKGGRFKLHSQTIQGTVQQFFQNLSTAHTLRAHEYEKTGFIKTKLPYKQKDYFTLAWKKSAIRVKENTVVLSNGLNQKPLVLEIPAYIQDLDVREVRLTWRADHYELCFSYGAPEKTKEELRAEKKLQKTGQLAGGDLGEINLIAVVTQEGDGLQISGRELRSKKRLRNKRHGAYQQKIAKTKKGSRRQKKALKQKARASAKLVRQQRDILHKASKKVVDYLREHNVKKLAIGDVRDIQDKVDLGKKVNQKIAQWPHGLFYSTIKYKAARYGIEVDWQDEAYSTRDCCFCGHRHERAPKGRVFVCKGCGREVPRDLNGASNICSRTLCEQHGCVGLRHLKYLRPLGKPRKRRSRAPDMGLSVQLRDVAR